ncbi:MAG: hypothetical protein GF320_21745 [Armatimonadia bacterium]|nr:hypothetical protein [Armatimonadia bacterium]
MTSRSACLRVCLVLAVLMSARAAAVEAEATVAPFPFDTLRYKADQVSVMAAYCDSVRQWVQVLDERARPVPGRQGQVYYGRGGTREDDVRPITYAALVHAFLATVPESMPTQRGRWRQSAIGALRYLADAHVTGDGECVDGGEWGDAWQSAMWTRSAGLAGWMLWSDLDPALRRGVARMVEHEANRFLDLEPKSREFGDTGAEENAWNAQILSLAAQMMPTHPRAGRWDQAAKLWMYNSLSVQADHEDDTVGDDGRPISDWVTTVNAHPDHTVENHGLVHVGYLKTSLALLLEGALPYVLAGEPVPGASLHHAEESFELLLSCMAWDASPVFFGGNDWKSYHSQNTDVIVYALMSLLAGDRRAARLETTALKYLRRIQRNEGGFYNVRRDIEFGGLCATRLIACYLAHAAIGQGAPPASEAELEAACTGVTHLEYGRAILHRTPTKFASFTWGPKDMALALPENGNWVIWPHFQSYLGAFDPPEGVDATGPEHELLAYPVSDGFIAMGRILHHGGTITQDVAFASPAADVTIYVERVAAPDGYSAESRLGAPIGLEYPLGANSRLLVGEFGRRRVVGVEEGDPRTTSLPSSWLTIDDRVGYVVLREADRLNVMRHRDEVRGEGRVPKLQEWISLIGDPQGLALGPDPEWACVITLLGERARAAEQVAGSASLRVQGARAEVAGPGFRVQVDFERGRCVYREDPH